MTYIGISYIKAMAEIIYTRTARKALDRLPADRQRQVVERVEALGAGRRADVKALAGSDHYRLRVGRYRVIFRRDGDTIVIETVAPRGAAY